MNISESFSIAAPRIEVAAFLLDVERMSKCVPGVGEVRAVGDNEFEAMLSIRLGPIHASFAGTVRIDSSESPARLAASASGRDGATGSQAQVEFTAFLSEMPDGSTTVESTSHVIIRGRLGQFGAGVITSTAKSILSEFAACASRSVEASHTDGHDGQRGKSVAPNQEGLSGPIHPGLVRVIRRSIGFYLSGLFKKLKGLWR